MVVKVSVAVEDWKATGDMRLLPLFGLPSQLPIFPL